MKMTKSCPECGKEVPDDAHFCADCGHDFFRKDTPKASSSNSGSIFTNGKIFLVLIAVVVIVGAVVILNSGFGENNGPAEVDDGIEHVKLTISDVSGYEGDSDGKTYYFLWTEALFTSVPKDQKGYIIKTIYCDKNGTSLGQETETLSHAYYETDYPISIGYHTMYKKPDLDHVNVEIIKDGKTIDNYTYEVDKNKIDFLS